MSDEVQSLIDTSDLKLAAWALCQAGAVVECIRSEVKSVRDDGHMPCTSDFVVDVSRCTTSRPDLIAAYASKDACPEITSYEQARARLLSDMRTSHDSARREYKANGR